MSSNQQIMGEDTARSIGRDAQRNNIAAAKAVAACVRTTLGPKGMDKMLVDGSGGVIVTNDGVTILREMHIEHPAAKMIVEVAKTQEEVVGDGTTSAVILSGELLRLAEDLLDQNIHPTIVARGYRMALREALAELVRIRVPVGIDQRDLLIKTVETAMTGKGAESQRRELADLLIRAVLRVAQQKEGKTEVDLAHIKVESYTSDQQSELIEGVVLEKERVHPSMPMRVEGARIALLDCPLEIRNTEIDAKIQITDPTQMSAFLDQEERVLREMVEKICLTGANVVLCQRGIDDVAQHFLSKRGVFAVRRVRKSDVEKLALATGARIVSSYKDLAACDLGEAGVVRETKVGDEEMVFVEGCRNPLSVTLLVSGSTTHIAQETVRAVEDALGDVMSALNEGFLVGGAGSCEMRIARHLDSFSSTLSGREQLAVRAFAKGLEVISRTLAENAGLDAIDMLTGIRGSQFTWPGVDVVSGRVVDAWEQGVIEPSKVKSVALRSACEVAEMILRIDDVILRGAEPMAGGSMSSMG